MANEPVEVKELGARVLGPLLPLWAGATLALLGCHHGLAIGIAAAVAWLILLLGERLALRVTDDGLVERYFGRRAVRHPWESVWKVEVAGDVAIVRAGRRAFCLPIWQRNVGRLVERAARAIEARNEAAGVTPGAPWPGVPDVPQMPVDELLGWLGLERGQTRTIVATDRLVALATRTGFPTLTIGASGIRVTRGEGAWQRSREIAWGGIRGLLPVCVPGGRMCRQVLADGESFALDDSAEQQQLAAAIERLLARRRGGLPPAQAYTIVAHDGDVPRRALSRMTGADEELVRGLSLVDA